MVSKTLSYVYIKGSLHKKSGTLIVQNTNTTTKSLRNASVHFYLFPFFLLFFHSVYFCFLFACFYFDILTAIQWWRHLFVLYAWESVCVSVCLVGYCLSPFWHIAHTHTSWPWCLKRHFKCHDKLASSSHSFLSCHLPLYGKYAGRNNQEFLFKKETFHHLHTYTHTPILTLIKQNAGQICWIFLVKLALFAWNSQKKTKTQERQGKRKTSKTKHKVQNEKQKT